MEKIAVIGGLGTLEGGDLFFKLLKNQQVLKNQLAYHFIFEQQPFSQINSPLYQEEDIKSRQYYTFNVSKNFESLGVTSILLPCFASHSFLDELQKEIAIPIISIFEALSEFLSLKIEKGAKIGVLTSDYVKAKGLLDRNFGDYDLIFPKQQLKLMEAIYGEQGIKKGHFEGIALEYVWEACTELVDQGCNIILPAITEISLVAEQLWKRGIPVIDVNQIYADYALKNEKYKPSKPFKLGIVGGVGPSATVDFMNKIIQNTPAQKDQEHIKMVVEQNPQIPDRTANLVFQETDPTIAMYSTCKRLEAEGADAIAIPCNTAHAFVSSIEEHLNIPIINMLTTTAESINERFGNEIKVGLLATNGTLQSKVYHDVLYAFGFDVIVPDKQRQVYVMDSIYGEYGVKAGYSSGACRDCIDQAIDFLIAEGAEVLILGCTELPLMFSHEDKISKGEKTVFLIDPTLILAKKVIEFSKKFHL